MEALVILEGQRRIRGGWAQCQSWGGMLWTCDSEPPFVQVEFSLPWLMTFQAD